MLLWSFADMRRIGKSLSCSKCTFPAEVEQGSTLPSCFSSHGVKQMSFMCLFSATFLCFLLVISLFKWRPTVVRKCYLGPKHMKAVMCFIEKIVLENFIQAQIIMLKSVLMSQSSILNKVSLNKHM